MKKILIGAVAVLLSFAFTLSSFAYTQVNVENEDYYKGLENEGITLNVYNWGLYISDEKDMLEVNKAFEKLTGIKINYTTYDTNESMYAKIKSGGGDYDVVFPSDYMVSKMASEGLLAELDFANIPNYKMIGDEYKNLAYDPQNKYSVAYTWGLVGVSYNKTMVDKEDLTGDWDLLWNEKYKGQILMFNNSRDAFAIAALMEGLPINPETTEQVSILAEKLKEQKPLVQSYVMDEIFDKMEGGEAAIAPYYAGDGVLMHSENSDIEMYIPKSGTNFYVDTVCVLNGSQNKKAAEMYINFLCETEVSVANCEFISYSTPQTVAQKLLPEEMKKSELLYPDKEVMKRATSFVMLSDEVNNAMDNAWSEIRSYEENGSYFIPVLIGVIGLVLVIIFLLKKRKKMKQDY